MIQIVDGYMHQLSPHKRWQWYSRCISARDVQEDEESMNVSGDTPHLSIELSTQQTRAISSRQAYMDRPSGRMMQTDQLNLSPKAREIHRAGQMLAQTAEVRETKVVTLMRDVASGRYQVRAEQIAEKIVEDHLLDLLR
jgi:flagellar biosynthesis anti-sigma factor FlgM